MKTILVVEDSRLTFELLRRALASSPQYSVEFFCKNAENLMEVYEQNRPDIVVMDIVMEGVNGIDMTRELMAYAGESNIRLVRAKSNMIIEDVKMLIERVVGDNIAVSYNLGENLPDVDVDLNQFWKVIFNIVKNANEAFAGQPGRIVLSTSALEMTDAKVLDMLDRISVLIFAISMACLFSTMTSSRSSASSSYFLMKFERTSFSNTASLERRPVEK